MRDFLKITWSDDSSQILENVKEVSYFEPGRALVRLANNKIYPDVKVEDMYWFYKCGRQPSDADYYDHSGGVAGYFTKQPDRSRFMYCGTLKDMEEHHEKYYR